MKALLLAVPVLIAAATAAAPAADVQLNRAAEQGGLVHGQAPAGTTALSLDGRPVRLAGDGRFLIGFGRDAAPLAVLGWTIGGVAHRRDLPVAQRQWAIQSLPTLPPHPVPDAEFEARRPAELEQIAAARAGSSDLMAWAGTFIAPARGPVTGVYGSQRILAGTPSTPHAGLDLAAPMGAPVVAPAAGVVRLAAGPFTLEGNLVMIDHGFGQVSAFLHLSRIDVQPGDVVKQGQVIGTVGRTGRATGPHLHWALTWTDVRVDPATIMVNEHPFL